MGAWRNAFLSAGKPMSIKFLVLGGFWWGECRFYFYGREEFSDKFSRITRLTVMIWYSNGTPREVSVRLLLPFLVASEIPGCSLSLCDPERKTPSQRPRRLLRPCLACCRHWGRTLEKACFCLPYEPRLLRHMSRFYWGGAWSSIDPF